MCSPRASKSVLSSWFLVFTSILLCSGVRAQHSESDERLVGVAKVDITPSYPVRLSGYGGRRAESEGVSQQLWAKALAIGSDADKPALLVTVDNCGIPEAMRVEVLKRLSKKAGITSERFAISFSHTHCGPCLSGALVNIFSSEIPPEHQAGIDRYSLELTDHLEAVALAALADRQPARLSWSTGSASFARNRRAAFGGPVDHSLPTMFVENLTGDLRAVFSSYACHATTLRFNQIHGDWPGSAMEAIERDHPGVVALIGIGCGADQNPHPRGTVELATQHGEEINAEIKRLLREDRSLIRGGLSCREKEIALPLDSVPSREVWEKVASGTDQPQAYAARKNLARLDKGEALPEAVPYRVQVWNFGEDLAMLFLPGEVTVDYSLRLKTEFDRARLWINAYSNDAPCYIPSRRVLAEGGYEGGMAMVYYDQPAPFAPGVEERVVAAAHDLIPAEFTAHYRADVPPQSPADSLAAIRVGEGLVVEIAAAEPFVADPVAIDWDARGRMWVVEQPDYPNGMDGKGKPGGRVRILTDTDGDGRYDRSDLFLEGIPFPTGITCWRGGVLVCAAPDILYCEDSDGDNRADKVEKLFTGFYTDNYNARINSLTLGLDNWIHGANGLLGGTIHSTRTGVDTDIAGRDLRIHPDTGELQLVSGVTQQGRTRDDWDNWFGCSNSRWIYHFPLPEAYLSRNRHVPGPPPSVYLPADPRSGELQAVSRQLERFNHPDSQGNITSACGLGIYRDDLLGAAYAGNAFIGETAHNLVRRYQLVADGATFAAQRPDGETDREFFASEDNWSRPVQIRTGPDGALYIVDMYRAVIEHTRWIPADRLAKVDPRAGDTMGRIYRVVPSGRKLRPVRDLTTLKGADLVAALDTSNGTTRDLVHQLLLHQKDRSTEEPLAGLVSSSARPAVRAQAAAVLDGLKALTPESLRDALQDEDPRVRRHAVRLSETRAMSSPDLLEACLQLSSDPDFTVRYQLVLSLGEWDKPEVASTLAEMARVDLEDSRFRAAVVSASTRWPQEVLKRLLTLPASGARDALVSDLVSTAAAIAEQSSDFENLLDVLAVTTNETPSAWQMKGLAGLQRALKRREIPRSSLAGAGEIQAIYTAARSIVADEKAAVGDREAALKLFGQGLAGAEIELPILSPLLKSSQIAVQKEAVSAMARLSGDGPPRAMLADWPQHSPGLRNQIIGTLVARDAGILALLEAVEKKVIHHGEISAATRQALSRHGNAAIRERIGNLFPTSAGGRAEVLRKYEGVSELRGDAVKGATVFKAACFACHSYIGDGMAVGPDLKAFYNKSDADFVTAIFDPNAAVEPRYAGYIVTTKDSRTLTGVVANETASSIEIVMPGGLRETILRSELLEIHATGVSLMPEGLEHSMTPQDVADLIAFLKSGG